MNNKTESKAYEGQYYIGLMSGTSADGIDLALVQFLPIKGALGCHPVLIASYYQAYSPCVTKKITELYQPSENEIDRAFCLDIELAVAFSDAIQNFLSEQALTAKDIIAIGNHGQTIRHRPNGRFPFTLQIGCNQTLATRTNIRVIGQFRRKDMAVGGQGAPLVPAFHQHIFNSADNDTFIVNIGGIANISFLPKDKLKPVLGFDTGPGNALLDDWYQTCHQDSQQNYDMSGQWAKTGQVNNELLDLLLADDYLLRPPPKSTGRECYNLAWLHQQLHVFEQDLKYVLPLEDIQATLTTFTAQSIVQAIVKLSHQANIYVCGGGAHNQVLMSELSQQFNTLPSHDFNLMRTNDVQVDGDSLEAMAFAWLAFAFDKQITSNLPCVTGASRSVTLGTVYFP